MRKRCEWICRNAKHQIECEIYRVCDPLLQAKMTNQCTIVSYTSVRRLLCHANSSLISRHGIAKALYTMTIDALRGLLRDDEVPGTN